MEILQFLLSFLATEYAGGKYEQVYKALEESNFDFKEMLKKLSVEDLKPVIDGVKSAFKSENPREFSRGLAPINNIADEKIIEKLNEYLSLT